MSELLKAQLVPVSEGRSRDALAGVGLSPLQSLAERSTVGPYNGELKGAEVKAFLADPATMLVVGCGRNEDLRGNLGPVLGYASAATRNGHADSLGNVLYVDGNSTDNSLAVAKDQGAVAVSRGEALNSSLADKERFAEILGVTSDSLERSLKGQETPGDVPLRKGIDVTIARIELLRMFHEGTLPKYVAYIDTDLKSIPGGQIADELTEDTLYFPIEMMGQGLLDLNRQQENGDTWAVFTGSENRNNEAIFGAFNAVKSRAVSRRLTSRQKEIALALSVSPGTLVHPLTGELSVAADVEAEMMGATGQAVEVARILTLAGKQFEAQRAFDLEASQTVAPFIGNVRRGEQLRIDEPQIDSKEWWMMLGVLTPFITVVANYAIDVSKLPHEFTLDDYREINLELSDITDMPRLDNQTQTRVFDRFTMERAIPPVALLHKEGIITL